MKPSPRVGVYVPFEFVKGLFNCLGVWPNAKEAEMSADGKIKGARFVESDGAFSSVLREEEFSGLKWRPATLEEAAVKSSKPE